MVVPGVEQVNTGHCRLRGILVVGDNASPFAINHVRKFIAPRYVFGNPWSDQCMQVLRVNNEGKG